MEILSEKDFLIQSIKKMGAEVDIQNLLDFSLIQSLLSAKEYSEIIGSDFIIKDWTVCHYHKGRFYEVLNATDSDLLLAVDNTERVNAEIFAVVSSRLIAKMFD